MSIKRYENITCHNSLVPFVRSLLATGTVIDFSAADHLVDHASIQNCWIYPGSRFQIHWRHSPISIPAD